MRKQWLGVALIAAGTCGVLSCSHGSPTSIDFSGCCGISITDVFLNPDGVTPVAISTKGGGEVIFFNRDTVPHQVGPTTSHPCPELAGPQIAPGEIFSAFMAKKTEYCTYLDRLNPDDTRFQGSISVTK